MPKKTKPKRIFIKFKQLDISVSSKNLKHKHMMKYLLLLLCSGGISAQQLHHQMISAQGTSTKLQNGMLVRSTVGQSVTNGTSQKGYVIQQGFQQNTWASYIDSPKNLNNAVITSTYPNPFTDIIHFKFSNFTDSRVAVLIYDITGREVVSQTIVCNNNEASIYLGNLPEAKYLVRLSAKNFEYFTKIIKN